MALTTAPMAAANTGTRNAEALSSPPKGLGAGPSPEVKKEVLTVEEPYQHPKPTGLRNGGDLVDFKVAGGDL